MLHLHSRSLFTNLAFAGWQPLRTEHETFVLLRRPLFTDFSESVKERVPIPVPGPHSLDENSQAYPWKDPYQNRID